MRKSITCILLLIAAAIVATGQTNQTATDTIRKADQDWLKVFAARNLKESVDFVLANGSVLAPNAPIATGPDEIRKLFAGFFALPDLKIQWNPNKIDVARSGEMGYSTGAYRMSFKDPSGKTVEDHGKYVTIWKKQGGKWKVASDIFNTDLATP